MITGNKIVVMGGEDENRECLSSVECFSFDSYLWEELPPMNEPRKKATAVVKPVQLSEPIESGENVLQL